MASHFILLEILDPAVNAFLWRIRTILGGRKANAPIHLTLRGPYAGERPTAALQSARAALRHDVLKIAGVGRFSNTNDEVVFFRVDSPHLRSVWYKPTFPIERYGFEPHISVYRGQDAALADAVSMFLQEERIELLCAEHQLVWHQSGQLDLLSQPTPTVGAMQDMYASNRVDPDILDRLQDLIDRRRREAMRFQCDNAQRSPR